jgi:hypothetical protein
LQHLAVLEQQLHLVVTALDGAHAGCAQQLHVGAVADGLVGGAANGLVGHQVAEAFGAGLLGADLQGEQRRAVEYLSIAQYGDVLGRQACPESQTFEQRLRAVSEGDLAAVEGRFGQRLFGLAFQHEDGQAVPGQGARQAQARGAGADDDDIG